MFEKKLLIVQRKLCIQNKLMVSFFLVTLLILTNPITKAQNNGHPLIKPFEGSVIQGQEVKEFDEQTLVIGKVQEDGSVNTVKLEGKVTRIDYGDPDNRSSLERIRNYEEAFKKAGFEIKFMCGKEECGHQIGIETIGFYPPERYLTAFLKRKEGNVWVGVFIPEGPWSKIIVVEEKPMETGMVKVTAEVFKSNILKDGHAAVYGIYFDTGKSVIKPESDETIKEIAALLKANSSMQVYIIGHTDNVGKLKDNMELSQKRAEAVVNELITKYKIPSANLEANGVGPLAPVATNDTEEGKELNRRVEIVKK